MSETKIETYYQARAKDLVDRIFEATLFKEGVTRDDMQAVENLIAFEYQSSANSAKRITEILLRVKK